MTLHLLAPAKLNLILEVIRKREDGYHEIASIMQTIDLCDRISLSPAATLELIVSGPEAAGVPEDPARNLAYRAAVALQRAARVTGAGARIEIEKHIPAAAGLGGGSSDAAAVLRGLYELWDVDVSFGEFVELGAALGSDVPFFFDGGTQTVGGRGEELTPLPDPEQALDFTLFTTDLSVEDKTRRMYAALGPADFSNGERAEAMAEALWRNEAPTDFFNAFDRAVAEVFPSVGAAMALCRGAGLSVIAAGAGPSFFAPVRLDSVDPALLEALQARHGLTACGCRSLSGAEALLVEET